MQTRRLSNPLFGVSGHEFRSDIVEGRCPVSVLLSLFQTTASFAASSVSNFGSQRFAIQFSEHSQSSFEFLFFFPGQNQIEYVGVGSIAHASIGHSQESFLAILSRRRARTTLIIAGELQFHSSQRVFVHGGRRFARFQFPASFDDDVVVVDVLQFHSQHVFRTTKMIEYIFVGAHLTARRARLIDLIVLSRLNAHVVTDGEFVAVEHFRPRETVHFHSLLAAQLDRLAQ